ncbi:MAG: histidine--tRNA ligase family protein, partial [Sulfolobus sp.]|nr:histidine--tRNA ligase family protein [Sulfolobus sp.]
GRYREFRQAGIELLGSNSILADIEVLSLIYTFYEKLNVVNEISVDINDIGVYREIFAKIGIDENKQEHILHLIDKKEIDDAIKELRSLGINEEAISLIQETINTKLNAVEEISKFIQDFKNSDYKEFILKHLYKLNQIYNIFKNIGYNIRIDLGLVRGLAYYTGFVFEIKHPNVNFSIGGGGRYDKLVELYGGSPTPAVGFALGIERNLIALRDKIKLTYKPKVAVILLDDNVTTYALNVVSELRKAGIEAVFNLKDVSLAKLLPYLPDEGYKLAIIIGKQEANSNNITLRDLIKRTQVTIEKDKAIDIVRQLL